MKLTDVIFTMARFISDGVAIFAGLMLAFFWRMQWFEPFFPAPATIMPLEIFRTWAIGIMIVLLFIFMLRGQYRLEQEEKFSREITQIFWALAAGLGIVLAYFFFAQSHFFSRLIFGIAGVSGLVFLVLGRSILRIILRLVHHRGWGRKNILVIGSGQIASQVVQNLKAQSRFNIHGLITEKTSQKKLLFGIKIVGSIDQLSKILKQKNIDEVWLASDQGTEDLTDQLIQQSHIHHKKFRFFPDELGMDLAAVSSSTFAGIPVLTLLSTKLDGWGLVGKTIFDLSFGVIMLVLLSPILIFISLTIWLDNPKAPVIYRSARVGKNGRHFNCLKFRTMIPGADKKKAALKSQNERDDILFKIKDDPRITRLGRWLRKYSIDELPQIFNVLTLDMSFIGPRPHLVEEVAKYPELNRQVLSIRPGITGFAQINGRSALSFAEEMRYEMFYLKNWSMWLDAVIFFKSILVVVSGKNH